MLSVAMESSGAGRHHFGSDYEGYAYICSVHNGHIAVILSNAYQEYRSINHDGHKSTTLHSGHSNLNRVQHT